MKIQYIALISVLLTGYCIGATLTVSNIVGSIGDAVIIPIQLKNNKTVVGIQFDVTFNSSVLSVKSLLKGTDIGNAMISSLAIEANTYRVIIINLNKNNLNNGELIKLNFKINTQANIGIYPIDIHNIQATNTKALTLTIDPKNIHSGSIKIQQ